MNRLVSVKRTTLTDGSYVYDVVTKPTQIDGQVIISAETEKAALTIAGAINEGAVAVYGQTVKL